MSRSKEIMTFLLFVILSSLLWWINASENNRTVVHSGETTENIEAEEDKLTTEKQMILPIVVQDVPDGSSIRVFPSKAVIFVRVHVSDYEAISEKDVRVWVSYPTGNQKTLTVHVDTNDDRIMKVITKTKQVEYLLEKEE